MPSAANCACLASLPVPLSWLLQCPLTVSTSSAQLALTIAMVIGIHFVEAYGLNPGACSFWERFMQLSAFTAARCHTRNICSRADTLTCCFTLAAIYSAHLKLHPLMVLSVLVIAEHSLGVWGLLLAGVLAFKRLFCRTCCVSQWPQQVLASMKAPASSTHCYHDVASSCQCSSNWLTCWWAVVPCSPADGFSAGLLHPVPDHHAD